MIPSLDLLLLCTYDDLIGCAVIITKNKESFQNYATHGMNTPACLGVFLSPPVVYPCALLYSIIAVAFMTTSLLIKIMQINMCV